ncbi:hypothetical protein TWF696_001641 [Orbilia brochopaga]|uniref:DUF7514 domain-containing protein n=1 Tax=Orbilia brochopaga TaxID=3140254 RepID=A0AAV9U5I9_9PEZI
MSLRHTIRSLLTGPQAQAQAPLNGPPQPYTGYPPLPAAYPFQHQPQPQPQQQQQQQFYAGYTPPPHQQQHHPQQQQYHQQEYQQQYQQQYQNHQQHQQQHYNYHQPQPQQQQQQQQFHHHSQGQPFYGQQPPPPHAQPLQQSPINPSVPQNVGSPLAAPVYHQPHSSPASPHAQQAPALFGAPPPIPSATHPSRQAHAQPPGHSYHHPSNSTATAYQDIPTSPPPPYVQTPQHGQTTFSHPSVPQTPSLSNVVAPPHGSPRGPTTLPSAASYQPPYAAPDKQEQELLNNLARPANEIQPTPSTAQSRDIFPPVLQQGSCTAAAAAAAALSPSSTAVTADEPSSPRVPGSLSTSSGIIHPSLLAQWTAAARQPNSPQHPSGRHTQSYNQELPSASNPHIASAQTTRPGHKSTGSVNRSLTFSKKNSDGSPNWSGTLLTIDGLPSETFTRFVDGIYNYAGQDDDPLGLTPDQMRVLFERLEIPDQDNHPKRLALNAHKMHAADPTNFLNTSMIQFYTTFNLTYITEANLMPLITRDGFQQYMTTSVLVDPSAMHICFNRLLAKFGHHIIDPPTKKPFGSVQIDRNCYPAIPNDQYVGQYRKQSEALAAKEKMDFTSYSGQRQTDVATPTSANGPGYGHQSSWGI